MSDRLNLRRNLLLPLLAAAMAVILVGCDALLGAGPAFCDDSNASGTGCQASLQGIPAFPPPPCWNEEGEIQSDEVCAKVHETSGDAQKEGEEGQLPAPPELPK